MFELLIFASIPAMVASISDEDAGQQAVTAKKNGEFLARQYPPKALKAGEEGKVGFRLVVEPDGSLGTCEVTASSGFRSLDDETCELILRYARLKPVRNADGRAVRAVQNGYINWAHPDKSIVVTAKSDANINAPDKIICKRTAKTGSLIARTKQCMTARQWAEAGRIARDSADRIVAKGHYADGMGCQTFKASGDCD